MNVLGTGVAKKRGQEFTTAFIHDFAVFPHRFIFARPAANRACPVLPPPAVSPQTISPDKPPTAFQACRFRGARLNRGDTHENRALKAIALFLMLTVLRPPAAGAGENPVDPPKRVLVELYTSQGCNSCPPASDLLGKLFELGDGPDRIVPLNFHVDYFNQPWPDPYSDASYTRRQRDYNSVQRRDDLQFTPLLMVDGRHPLLGSDRAKAVAAIEQALKMPPEVALDLDLDGTGIRKTVSVKIAARSPEVAGRELLIGMALTEDPVTTKVLRGENAGADARRTSRRPPTRPQVSQARSDGISGPLLPHRTPRRPGRNALSSDRLRPGSRQRQRLPVRRTALDSTKSHRRPRRSCSHARPSRRTTKGALRRIGPAHEPARIRFRGDDSRRSLQHRACDLSRLRLSRQSTDQRFELSPSWSGIPAVRRPLLNGRLSPPGVSGLCILIN